MALTLKNFARLVQDAAAAVQTKSSQLLALDVGSVLRAFVEAVAALGLWEQANTVYVLQTTRLSTSFGTDVDSFVNDWGVFRIGATLASGEVTYSRFTPQGSVVIPVGALVQTGDGSQQFRVVASAAYSTYSSAQNAYVMPDQVSSITVPVQSVTGSVGANVLAGAVSVMYTTVVGADFVTNDNDFAGGQNAESDQALKDRFVLFINSLSKGTLNAIRYAVASLQLGLSCSIIENMTPDGSVKSGFLWVVIDDGSGAPPAATLSEAAQAVGATRAAGVMWGVFSPVVLQATIAIILETDTGYDHNTVVATVATAVKQFVNTLPLGQGLAFLKLAQVVQNAASGITGVTMFVNGSSADIVAAPQNVVKILTLTVV